MKKIVSLILLACLLLAILAMAACGREDDNKGENTGEVINSDQPPASDTELTPSQEDTEKNVEGRD